MENKFSFIRALRPFSLIVAVATCGLGISLALLDGFTQYQLAILVMLSGILLQMAVNLVNDYSDIDKLHVSSSQRNLIRRNTRVGWALMLICILLGLYLVSIRGLPLLLLGIVGIFGAWAYTGGRINYKNRGLGVVLVFFLMGNLLIGGSYFVVSGKVPWRVFCLSLPFSLLSSLLLLSNELRDFEQDHAQNVRTLSVRLGYSRAVKLYLALVLLTYLCSFFLYGLGLLPSLFFILLSIAALWHPLMLLKAPAQLRQRLTPLTGRFYFVFSLTFLFTLWEPLL